MKEARLQAGNALILYDADALEVISPEWLFPQFWTRRQQVIATFGGRARALAVATDVGPAVLRRYHRGGMIARVVRDRYLFTGHERSRALREWRVLARLHARGLPVPAPLMASCERSGFTYRAGLLTRLIEGAVSLAEAGHGLQAGHWQRLGATLARFSRAGVAHADLNAHNLLVDADGRWYVIDFDRARIDGGPVDPAPMLGRLERSLDKLGIAGHREDMAEVWRRDLETLSGGHSQNRRG
jgi:3-deoxy-D-manno-octulosonic acid kinase